MNKKFLWAVLIFFTFTLMITACAGPAPLAHEGPAAEEPVTPTPTAAALSEVAIPQATPTETPLAPLILPTPLATPPAFQNWGGPPTYPAETVPGTYFRVRFDPRNWALTEDQFGQTVLAHRQILACIITPAAGRGMPLTIRVEHGFRTIGALNFEVNTAYESEVMKFVVYLGGDADLYTGFQVAFENNAAACLNDAEGVLATLISINEADAESLP